MDSTWCSKTSIPTSSWKVPVVTISSLGSCCGAISIAVQESQEVHPAPWVSAVACAVLYCTSPVFYYCASQLTFRASDNLFCRLWKPKGFLPSTWRGLSSYLFMQGSCSTSQISPSPLLALGLLGVQSFSTEMPGVILAFMIASIVKVGECQGHTPGDT